MLTRARYPTAASYREAELAEIAVFISSGAMQMLRPAYATGTNSRLGITEEQLRLAAVAIQVLKREDRLERLKRLFARANRRHGSNWWSGVAA